MHRLKSLKKFIYGSLPYYVTKWINPQSKFLKYFEYIKNYGYMRHLYLFRHDYADFNVKLQYDVNDGLPYVELPDNKRKLYFRNDMEPEKIKRLFKELIIEQDLRSPHRYFDDVKELSGKRLLDVGSAEGLITLLAIEELKHAYIFECDEKWIEALNKTFAPYNDKVTIIRKYVGDKDNDECITLDTFVDCILDEDLFLKMDIEGMERVALSGAQRLFSESKSLNFAICTYHNNDDFNVISEFLKKHKCHYTSQHGYWRHRYISVMLRGNTTKTNSK